MLVWQNGISIFFKEKLILVELVENRIEISLLPLEDNKIEEISKELFLFVNEIKPFVENLVPKAEIEMECSKCKKQQKKG